MKRTFLTFALLSAFVIVKGQPSITDLSYPASVNLFQKFEISFKLGQYLNPYDPDTISVYAIFTGPNNRCDSVIGFYYEGYTFQKINGYEVATRDNSRYATGWRIRFTPDVVGTWYFCIHAIDRHGETVLCSSRYIPFTFSCLSVSNAKGFITKANSRYLKREVVNNNHRYYRSFFPVGPNVAWYSYVGNLGHPKGFYEYEDRIDSLVNNGNYMRVWINRYPYLSLYGPEYTETPPTSYFDTTLNQKDAAELDSIISYAAQNDIALMLCFFSFGDFNYRDPDDPNDADCWEINPYNSLLDDPCDFFEDNNAKRVARNLIRYIVARWGYATNIMSWELWNEVTNMPCEGYKPFEENVFIWHKIMSDYIREIDPFHHCISTSMSEDDVYLPLFSELYLYLDFVQWHDYQNFNKAASNQQFSYILYNLSNYARTEYPNMPFFMGEFGFGKFENFSHKDPYGIDLHNSLWSSLFSTSIGPASLWWWHYLFSDPTHLNNPWLIKRYGPVLIFCQNLPILSDSFEAFTTGRTQGYKLVFDNNIETYYMKNGTEDTIYGWSQDTAFAYQSLRWLTDSVIPLGQDHGLHFIDTVVFDPNGYVYTLDPLKRPHPSSNSNLIKITFSNVPNGTQYEVHWFNSETGLEYNNATTYSVVQDIMGEKYIHISFPSFIRNLNTNTINNTFGDVVFAIYRINTIEDSKKKDNKNKILTLPLQNN